MAEKLSPAPPKKEKTDWLPLAAVGLGGAGLAAGLYFFMKKPPGIDPGDSFTARFKVTYAGPPGQTYVIQVSLGEKWPLVPLFDREETIPVFTAEVQTTGEISYEWDLVCELPETAKPHKYDAEALIRTPEMSDRDYLIKVYKEEAVVVRKL